ncbi:hypothetical protein C8R47DRAFT_1322550 [Mycena vitilis]|nr:hypothetical protein C8R47DRAFT_1322550 [Mycena vitilis]
MSIPLVHGYVGKPAAALGRGIILALFTLAHPTLLSLLTAFPPQHTRHVCVIAALDIRAEDGGCSERGEEHVGTSAECYRAVALRSGISPTRKAKLPLSASARPPSHSYGKDNDHRISDGKRAQCEPPTVASRLGPRSPCSRFSLRLGEEDESRLGLGGWVVPLVFPRRRARPFLGRRCHSPHARGRCPHPERATSSTPSTSQGADASRTTSGHRLRFMLRRIRCTLSVHPLRAPRRQSSMLPADPLQPPRERSPCPRARRKDDPPPAVLRADSPGRARRDILIHKEIVDGMDRESGTQSSRLAVDH